jgi:hypothetical protein
MNLAIAMLGQTELESPDDGGELGEKLRAQWDAAVEIAFEKGSWDCAKVRRILGRSGETPLFGYRYYYTVPPEMTRILSVSDTTDDPDNEFLAWEGEPGKIATNAEALYVTGVSRQQFNIVGRWSHSMARYVATELALLAAPKINPPAAEGIGKERKKALSDATGLDAVQGPRKRPRMGDWSRAARGYGRGGGGEQGR